MFASPFCTQTHERKEMSARGKNPIATKVSRRINFLFGGLGDVRKFRDRRY